MIIFIFTTMYDPFGDEDDDNEDLPLPPFNVARRMDRFERMLICMSGVINIETKTNEKPQTTHEKKSSNQDSMPQPPGTPHGVRRRLLASPSSVQ